MTITNEYDTTILSSYNIFKKIDSFKNIKALEPILFNEVKKNSNKVSVPDYLFKNIQQGIFENSKNFRELLNNSLDSLSSSLYVKENNIYIKDAEFQNWQSIITKISPLLIISYFIYKKNIDKNIIDNFKHSLLLSIYNKKLNKLLSENTIVDTHIHLNGTTEADIVWQDILQYPKLFIKEMEKSINNDNVSEQYLLLDSSLDIKMMTENIYEIRTIKDSLVKELNIIHKYTTVDEINFFVEAFKKINLEKKCRDTFNIWKYILKYNFIYQLLVQQDKQVGFDQFEKITQNELREYSEKSYLKRYSQINSIYNDNIVLEGRFAPKNDNKKMVKLLDSILANKKNISLVAHFIKQQDTQLLDENFIYRDMKLRIDLEKRSKLLVSLIKNNNIYKEHIRGFDGAGNELHTRPEVFAPTFKFLRKESIDGFTFHGGEDFIDIVSGIRYIYEIVEFLEFEHGDRIGHATAIGIDPQLWKSRIGNEVSISQGEYFDNLVFTYYILSDNFKNGKYLNKLKDKIQQLCYKLYDEYLDISLLINAWKMRKENPQEVLQWKTSLCNDYKKLYSQKEIDIYKKYYSNINTIQAYKKIINIKTDFLKDKILILLQNNMIELLNKKNIIIETMLSSNVKISFYKSYDEHHIKRWLGLGKSKKYPKPTLTIATDDPGIFATNMRNELAHLYLILKNSDLDENRIFKIITSLIENNNIWKL